MRSIGAMIDGSYALRSPDYVTSVLLTTTAQEIATPSTLGVTHAFFSSQVDFAVGYGSSALAVTASFSTATSSGCELNPTQRFLGKGQVGALSLIGMSTGYLSVAFFNSGST